jgi:phosphatidylserine decarboxylase
VSSVNMATYPHQYIHRETGEVRTESLFADRIVNFLYDTARERTPTLFRLLTSARMSALLGALRYDWRPPARRSFLANLGIDLGECLDSPESLNTPRKVFERRIRFWETRPMTALPEAVVSPADARLLVGSFAETSQLFLKEKFFSYQELLGVDCHQWLSRFAEGDFAIFRLTPDKYHYNHLPVAGEVVDIYELDGVFNSCNPGALMTVSTPYSKNRRVVTVIDTDIPGGTGVGLVAMIEIVALMIGDIVQCYSHQHYDIPRQVRRGMFLRKGQPKSLYRPGSSTDVLIFQKGRIAFSDDLVRNMRRTDAQSRFSLGFQHSVVETEVRVRSTIAKPKMETY